jgi:hypothetical protein
VYVCVVLCIVCFVTFPVLFVCTCVLNNCHRMATQLQLNISYHILSSGSELARGGSVLRFLGPEPALGVLRRDIRRKISLWLVNQHSARWQGLGETQRQARELISGRCLGAKARFLSFNRTQSRVVSGVLTGRNTQRRHLHLLGLLDSPLCRRCGVKEETSAHILCECEALVSFRHAYLGSFFLEPEDINKFGGHLEL